MNRLSQIQSFHMQRFFCLAVLVPLLLACSLNVANATDKPQVKLDLFLVWGTDGEKPEGKNLKELDENFTKKFRIFKWKNYFEVKRVPVTLKAGDPAKTVKMSNKCSVVLAYTGKQELEVELLGEGKVVYKGKHAMPQEDLIVAGDDVNSTAWFVVIKPQEEKK